MATEYRFFGISWGPDPDDIRRPLSITVDIGVGKSDRIQKIAITRHELARLAVDVAKAQSVLARRTFEPHRFEGPEGTTCLYCRLPHNDRAHTGMS